MATNTSPAVWHWLAFIVAVGAASTAVEIAGLRLLAPLFGSSLPVWGGAIATVLAGLAWGYSHGSRLALGPVSAQLVFRRAAVAAALFLWLPAVFELASRLREYSVAGLAPASLGVAFCLAFLALLLPSFCFGTVSPLAVQVQAQMKQRPAGHVAGQISTLLTVGSLLGILVPSFLTIPLFGIRFTVWIFAGLVLVLSWPGVRRQANLAWLAAAAGLLSSLLPAGQAADVIFAQETAHQHVTVRSEENNRRLSFDADLGTQSLFTPELYTGGYWDYVAALPAFLPRHSPLRVAVLGAAASTTERQMENFWKGTIDFEFTSVELDSALFPIAEAYFDPPPRRTVAADARAFVSADTGTYDLILLDAYSRELSVPFHLTTQEFFVLVEKRLAPDGLFVANANASSPDTLWVRSLASTLAAVFPEVRLAQVPESCNHLLIASLQPLTEHEAPAALAPLLPALRQTEPIPSPGLILTDNRAPTDWLGISALLASSETSTCG